MFQDDSGVVSVLDPADLQKARPLVGAGQDIGFDEEDKKPPQGQMHLPPYVQEINNTYKSNRSHVFILHGGVNDYPDNSGIRSSLSMTLSLAYDYFWLAENCRQAKQPIPTNPQVNGKPVPIVVKWSIANGLEFPTVESKMLFRDVLLSDERFKNYPVEKLTPVDPIAALVLLNDYFQISAQLFRTNAAQRAILSNKAGHKGDRTKALLYLQEHKEANLTVLWEDAKMMFPACDTATAAGDRTPIAFLEHWALDGAIAPRNKIILLTQHVSDIQSSLRNGDSHVSSIRIKRPDVKERNEWIANFAQYVKVSPAWVNGKEYKDLLLAEDLTIDMIANLAAGMSRRQIEGIFMASWLEGKPADTSLVARHKKEAIVSEYGDILDIRQPVGGWSLLGYHDKLIQWATRHVVYPMLLGDRRNMTKGGLMLGPPGVGKSWFAECLAGECGVNFVTVDLSKVFTGEVGGTEKNMGRLMEAIEAMAPCVAFFDEVDSAGLQRQSSGDSGVSARVFNVLMKWLSDEARWGKVVALAASNRPDMLDAAFIRDGRFDQKLAVLPPAPGNAEGRAVILNALSRKSNIVFDVSLKDTLKNEASGIGRLLLDKRMWTGAEMETLLKRAFSNAYNRKIEEGAHKKLSKAQLLQHILTTTKTLRVSLEDWNKAMDTYRPSTRDVEAMIDLALDYCNDSEYVPGDWVDRFSDKDGIKKRLATFVGGGESYERG